MPVFSRSGAAIQAAAPAQPDEVQTRRISTWSGRRAKHAVTVRPASGTESDRPSGSL
jgi:hypothetical protein